MQLIEKKMSKTKMIVNNAIVACGYFNETPLPINILGYLDKNYPINYSIFHGTNGQYHANLWIAYCSYRYQFLHTLQFPRITLPMFLNYLYSGFHSTPTTIPR